MSVSEDLIQFDVIETQKENIQSLPGGRSAKALAQIFSSGSNGDKFTSPSPNDTKTLNDAIRQEYEAELQASTDCDDPLDVYDRHVKWMLNAYPSAQATAESGLLQLLERATKAFLTSTHYRNDPRYLRLWLHYIRLFSDAPRETFSFLARHHVGEALALFYEEFAAWLESAGRWTQAEEVFKLGLQRDARPQERLLRKFHEFQTRFDQRPQSSEGPSSPALPAVRPALAAKVDPFSAAPPTPVDPQAPRSRGLAGGASSKPGKPKLAVFSDSDASVNSQPPVNEQSKGWDSIGAIRERRKENTVEAKPWAGETLKSERSKGPVQKMAIFRDESNSNTQDQPLVRRIPQEVPEHHVREAMNPRTGRRERVFVNLEAVYPDYKNPSYEVSFEELRARSRGWTTKHWKSSKKALKEIPDNAAGRTQLLQDAKQESTDQTLAEEAKQKLNLEDNVSGQNESPSNAEEPRESRMAKVKKIKMKEIGETQTIKTNLDSPTGRKIRRKNNSEPTMTFHTRAATDEIYNIFNQPLKSETETPDHGDSLFDSDYEDDDYTSAGESTGTGRVSAETSEFGDDETSSLRRPVEDDEDEDVESLGEWTEFSTSKHVPKISSVGEPTDGLENIEPGEGSVSRAHEKDKFIPEMPEDYDAPTGPYRDAAVMAQNRLPFMTPIIEKTESSLPSYTAARSRLYDTKTPCKTVEEIDYTSPGSPAEDLLLASPDPNTQVIPSIQSPSPAIKSLRRTPVKQTLPVKIVETDSIIKDEQCDPTDKAIRNKILRTIQPPLTAYPGYHDHSTLFGIHAADIQKYSKTLKKSSKSGDKASFTPPVLSLPGAQRSYAIRRELGAGAYAPVYLAESLVNVDTYRSASEGELEKDSKAHSLSSSQRPDHDAIRYGLEAIKMETDSPSGWEFYMIQTAHARLKDSPSLCRAADSIVQAHEVHIFKDESFLVEGYHGQGTLLDLVNIIRTEAITSTGNSEAGMDEALAMFFSIELFRTIEALHSCGILHGDIKPDNCLVRFPEKPRSALPPSPSESLIDLADDDITADPSEIHYSPRGLCSWRHKGLTLIDFGRGIDLKAFRQDVQFIAEWDISQHECNEVREMRPWSYHIDLYGVAVTIHAMLFGKYLESVPVCGDESRHSGSRDSFTTGPGLGPDGGGGNSKRYRIRESFKRYWEREIWTDVFDLLLNPGSDRWVQMEKSSGNPASLPVLHSMRHVREKMEAWLVANAEKKALSLQIRKLEAHLSRRKERLDKER